MAEEAKPDATGDNSKRRWHELLEMAIAVSRASGGAVWRVDARLQPHLLTQHQLGEQRLDTVHQSWPGHETNLQDAIRTGQSKSLDATFEQPTGIQELKLFLIPIVHEQQVRFVLELFLARHGGAPLPQVENSVRQLLTWAAPTNDAAVTSGAAEFVAWLTQIHRHISLDKTAYAIVNETQTWSRWERVSLLVKEGRRFRLKAVSGIDVLDPRSSTVRAIEHYTNSRDQENLEGRADDQCSDLANYCKQVGSLQSELTGLWGTAGTSNEQIIGALLFDQFSENAKVRNSEDDYVLIRKNVSTALDHALQYEQARANSLVRATRFLSSYRFARLCATALILVTVLLSLTFSRRTLTISGNGILEPSNRRDLFANVNGLIAELHASTDQHVEQGDEVVTLRSPELEFELNRIDGELQTVAQQISDLEKLRTDPRRAAELRQTANELAARGEELKSLEASLKRQRELLAQQSGELVLRSPIAGEVITSGLDELLSQSRPVMRTDRLLTVADLSGDWTARLFVDHRDLGPVLNAHQNGSLTVTFVTSDSPETARPATVQKLSPVVTSEASRGTTLLVEAKVDRHEIPETRPGTTILYRMDCGQSRTGYVWFRRFIDRVASWWTLL